MKTEGALWAQTQPYDRYFDFIGADADRYAILLECMEALKFNCAVLPVAGNRHIVIFPPGQKSLRNAGGVFPFSGKSPYILLAHYDRVPGSPGANDNSIAVFHLLKAAGTFARKSLNDWIIIFTDKEELAPGESFEAQGSYTLAEKLKTWGLEKAKVYNFDACGAGSAFVFSTTTDHILKDSDNPNIRRVRESIRNLRDHALAAADKLRLEKILLAPTPFSDDVGFLRAGLAVQTVTMLPLQEADKYETILRSRNNFADLIVSGAVKEPHEYGNLPETWRTLNSSGDTPSRLTPEHFDQTVNFMTELIS